MAARVDASCILTSRRAVRAFPLPHFASASFRATIWSYRAGADRNEAVQAIALLANFGVAPMGSSIPAWKVVANTLDDDSLAG